MSRRASLLLAAGLATLSTLIAAAIAAASVRWQPSHPFDIIGLFWLLDNIGNLFVTLWLVLSAAIAIACWLVLIVDVLLGAFIVRR